MKQSLADLFDSLIAALFVVMVVGMSHEWPFFSIGMLTLGFFLYKQVKHDENKERTTEQTTKV